MRSREQKRAKADNKVLQTVPSVKAARPGVGLPGQDRVLQPWASNFLCAVRSRLAHRGEEYVVQKGLHVRRLNRELPNTAET